MPQNFRQEWIFAPIYQLGNPLNRLKDVLFQRVYISLLPKGYEAQIRPRSGLAIKKESLYSIRLERLMPIIVVKSVLFLVNLSAEPFVIEDGERIAQMVIAPRTSWSGPVYKHWMRQNVAVGWHTGKDGFNCFAFTKSKKIIIMMYFRRGKEFVAWPD